VLASILTDTATRESARRALSLSLSYEEGLWRVQGEVEATSRWAGGDELQIRDELQGGPLLRDGRRRDEERGGGDPLTWAEMWG
jgi:hypothetical protein